MVFAFSSICLITPLMTERLPDFSDPQMVSVRERVYIDNLYCIYMVGFRSEGYNIGAKIHSLAKFNGVYEGKRRACG